MNLSAEWQKFLTAFDWTKLFQTIAERSIQIILVTLVFHIGRQLVNRFFESRFHHLLFSKTALNTPQRLNTLLTLTRNAINYAFYFLYGYTILAILGFPVSTLLAGAGIAGVAVGFGVKDFIADVINGFFIILEGQYEVGEEVKIGDVKGIVQTVGIRTTILQGSSGTRYYIPNGDISIVNNLSRENRQILIELPITDQTQLEALAEQVVRITAQIEAEYTQYITAKPVITGLVHETAQGFRYQIAFYVVNGMQTQLTGKFYYRYLTELQKNQIHLLA